MKPAKRKSVVWNFFTKSSDNKLVTCTICRKNFKFFQNTTNLIHHLKRMHPLIFKSTEHYSIPDESTTSKEIKVLESYNLGEIVDMQSPSCSDQINNFEVISNEPESTFEVLGPSLAVQEHNYPTRKQPRVSRQLKLYNSKKLDEISESPQAEVDECVVIKIQQDITEKSDVENVEEVTVEELLISCVEARPPLWDSRLPMKDRSKTIKDNLWKEIFQEFDDPKFSINYLIKYWTYLRDRYVRLKREQSLSDSSANKKTKWEYFDALSFLDDSLYYRPSVSNLDVHSPSVLNTHKVEHPLVDEWKQFSEKYGSPPPSSTSDNIPINPISKRISELLQKMPEKPRTELEIKLLRLTYEGARDYLI